MVGALVALVVIVVLVLAALSARIVREYERIVVFRLGRLLGPRGPGLVWIFPLLDRTQQVFNEQLKTRIDAATEPWGVQVVGVETKDIDLPDTMQRAMARQAAERLAEAAALLGREKDAITLRTLQTLAEVAIEQNSTLIFPAPADLISSLRWGKPPVSD
jgi:regulator of protease activity HflC (stomatin/prohibitin superfamily)